MKVKIKKGKLSVDNQRLPVWLFSVEFEVLQEYDDRVVVRHGGYPYTFYKKDIIKTPSK